MTGKWYPEIIFYITVYLYRSLHILFLQDPRMVLQLAQLATDFQEKKNKVHEKGRTEILKTSCKDRCTWWPKRNEVGQGFGLGTPNCGHYMRLQHQAGTLS